MIALAGLEPSPTATVPSHWPSGTLLLSGFLLLLLLLVPVRRFGGVDAGDVRAQLVHGFDASHVSLWWEARSQAMWHSLLVVLDTVKYYSSTSLQIGHSVLGDHCPQCYTSARLLGLTNELHTACVVRCRQS